MPTMQQPRVRPSRSSLQWLGPGLGAGMPSAAAFLATCLALALPVLAGTDFDIQVDPQKLSQYKLNPDRVSKQIQAGLATLDRNLSDADFQAQAEALPITCPDGKRIALRDIAGVVPKGPTTRPVKARVSIDLDQQRLDAFKLTAQDVSAQIKAQIKALTVAELEKVVIKTPGGRSVPLREIASFKLMPLTGNTDEPKDAGEPADQPRGPVKPTCAVVPFQVLGDLEVKDAGAIVAERLLPLLAETYRVIDQAQLAAFRDQDALTMADLAALAEPEKKPPPKALKLRAVKLLVVGSISSAPDGVAVTARLSDWQSGQIDRAAYIRAVDWDSLMDRLPYLAAKLAGAPWPDQPGLAPLGEVEFRIVPNLPDTGKEPELTEKDIRAMLERLTAGDYRVEPGDKYAWALLKDVPAGFTTAKVKDRMLAIVCNRPSMAMLANPGPKASWAVERATAGKDSLGQPALFIRLDPRGSARMQELTKANIGNRMAILVDGKILAAPVIQSMVSREAVVTGNFSDKQARDLAQAVARTMKAAKTPAKTSE